MPIAPPQTEGPNIHALSTIIDNPRLAKGLSGTIVAQEAINHLTRWARRLRAMTATTVTIQDDPHDRLLYGAVLRDLQNRDTKRGNIIATASRREGAAWELIPWMNPETSSIIRIGTQWVHVSSTDRSHNQGSGSSYEAKDIVITCMTVQARDAVIEWLAGLIEEHNVEARPGIFYPDNWGEWRRAGDLPERDLASVVLPDNQLDDLVDDLTQFLGAEKVYDRTGTPWHRGYLFHGLPGTGKTSTALALASHFGLAIHVLPAGALPKDATLDGLVAQLPPRSILLVEDVDAASGARDRDRESVDTASASALLNNLDGITTPRGLVAILTTNREDVLDRALVRSGRVNKSVAFGAITKAQTAALVEWLTDGQPLGSQFDFEVGPDTTASDVVSAVMPQLID